MRLERTSLSVAPQVTLLFRCGSSGAYQFPADLGWVGVKLLVQRPGFFQIEWVRGQCKFRPCPGHACNHRGAHPRANDGSKGSRGCAILSWGRWWFDHWRIPWRGETTWSAHIFPTREVLFLVALVRNLRSMKITRRTWSMRVQTPMRLGWGVWVAGWVLENSTPPSATQGASTAWVDGTLVADPLLGAGPGTGGGKKTPLFFFGSFLKCLLSEGQKRTKWLACKKISYLYKDI